MIGVDQFSHRLECYNPAKMQFSISLEELVRKVLPSPQNKTLIRNYFKIVPENNDKIFSTNEIEGIFDGLCKCLNCVKIIYDEPRKRYLIGDTWALCWEFSRQSANKNSKEVAVRPESVSGNFYYLDGIEIEFYYVHKETYEKLLEYAKGINWKVIFEFDAPKEGISVQFAFPSIKGVDYITQAFSDLSLDTVEQNYSNEVILKAKKLLNDAGNITHGIVLINGPVGTGKSYLIRSLLTELSERSAVVCTPPTTFLTQAGLLAQVAANFRKSVIVLEDVGEVVSVDSPSHYMDARSNLLNFAEGFLSLLMDTIIILSFNYDIDKIDPAILRPGRCLTNIKVNKLPYDHARKLVDFELDRREYSLAEIYEIRKTGYLECNCNNKGFGFKK